METQQFKSISLRQMFDNAISGRPINCHAVTLFDLSDVDLEDDSKVIIDNDFGDPLENIQMVRDFAAVQREKNSNQVNPDNNKKGGIENEKKNETRSPDASPQTLPEK